MTRIAMVPARSGSTRIPGKNVRQLGGHPLLAYSIRAAIESGEFDRVVVSTDAPIIADIASHYGAEVPALRPADVAGSLSPDIDWVLHMLRTLRDHGDDPTVIAILRPTSPLRSIETIHRAMVEFAEDPEVHSLRAVELCLQHPGKMWVVDDHRMRPLLDDGGAQPPWHSQPYQALPPVYVQNASLEVARVDAVLQTGTISGHVIRPFVTEGYEGFDLNVPTDWLLLEQLVLDGEVTLPAISTPPYPGPIA
jgi:CMP-N,N'-diacetyllegionaminic acid synthase